MVRLLTPLAFAKTWALLREGTGLEAVYTDIVLFDSRNHLIVRQ